MLISIYLQGLRTKWMYDELDCVLFFLLVNLSVNQSDPFHLNELNEHRNGYVDEWLINYFIC